MNARLLTSFALCSLLVVGCEMLGLPTGGGSQEVLTASSVEPFEIEIGQTVVLDDLNAEIRFVEVPEDSRCPIGVECFWAGRVRAMFVLTYQRGVHAMTFEGFVGGTDEGGGLLERAADLAILLTALAPYPVYDPDTGQSTRGRTATLVVTVAHSD